MATAVFINIGNHLHTTFIVPCAFFLFVVHVYCETVVIVCLFLDIQAWALAGIHASQKRKQTQGSRNNYIVHSPSLWPWSVDAMKNSRGICSVIISTCHYQESVNGVIRTWCDNLVVVHLRGVALILVRISPTWAVGKHPCVPWVSDGYWLKVIT